MSVREDVEKAFGVSWHFSSGMVGLGQVHEGRREECPELPCSLRGKTVHHLNGDPSDNRPQNLQVVDVENHR